MSQLVSSLWSFPPRRYEVVYVRKSPLLPLDVASSLSSGVGYLFESFYSIWLKTAQHLVVILLFLGEKLSSSPSIPPSSSHLLTMDFKFNFALSWKTNHLLYSVYCISFFFVILFFK